MLISVIVPVYYSEATLDACITGLERQRYRDFEMMFVDSTPDDRCAAIIRRYPRAVLIRSPVRLWMHAARNVGARASRGEILVFTDPDCVPAEDWLSRLDESFRQKKRVVGGAVACYPGGYRESSAHLVKYWKWLPNGRSGPIDDITSANFALERPVFEAAGGFSEDFICADTLLSYRLRDLGLGLYFNASAVVYHLHQTTVTALVRERFGRGKDFASMRSTLSGWNRMKSLLLLIGIWFLPLRHLYWRMRVYLQRGFFQRALIAIPVVLSSDIAWMAGQGVACWRHLVGRKPLTIKG